MTKGNDEALRKLVAKLPATWKCCDCGRSFPAGPYDPFPMANRYQTGSDGRQHIVGEICNACVQDRK